MKLTGYRSIIFALVMGMGGLLGHHLAPDTVNAWLDVFCATIAVGGILLRFVTSTPAFQAEAQAIGLPPELRDALLSISGHIRGTTPDIIAAMNQLNSAMTAIAGHPLANPQIMALLTDALRNAANPIVVQTDFVADPGNGGGGGGPSPDQMAAGATALQSAPAA